MSVSGQHYLASLPELYRQMTGAESAPVDLSSLSKSYRCRDDLRDALTWDPAFELSAAMAVKIVTNFNEKTVASLKSLLYQQQLSTINTVFQAIANHGSKLDISAAKKQLFSARTDSHDIGCQLMQNYSAQLRDLLTMEERFTSFGLVKNGSKLLGDLGITQREETLLWLDHSEQDVGTFEALAVRILMSEYLITSVRDWNDPAADREMLISDAREEVQSEIEDKCRNDYQDMLKLLSGGT